MARHRFVLTGDVDWASEYCLDAYVRHMVRRGIVPTLFVTHRSAVLEGLAAAGKVQLGIHPNFGPGSSHGGTVEEVLDHVLALVPEPVASRSHCYVDSSAIAAALARRGIALDSNLCCHLQQGLPALRHWNGVLRLPVFFEDDVHWTTGGHWNFAEYREDFASPGVKVLNFHPFIWALNVPDGQFYAAQRNRIATLAAHEAQALRHRGAGAATFLEAVIDWVRSSGGEFVTLAQLCRNL